MRYLGTVILALLVGCGGDDDKQKKAAGPTRTAPDAEPSTPKPDPAARAKAEQARDALKAKVKRLDERLQEILKRHAEENRSLPDRQQMRQMRKGFSQLRRDAINSSVKLRKMERRLEALSALAESATAGEVKGLRAQAKAVEKRRDDATRTWDKARAEVRMGKVEESPVKRDLEMCRSVKLKWFDVTPDARRGKKGAKSKINSTFREWLKAKPARHAMCAKVLSQPIAPKGKTPNNYDFSKLDFYLLIEIYENELDKLNIAVEKKETKEAAAKVDAIQKELDAMLEKIDAAMQKGGSEFEEYLDLKSRIKTVRAIDSGLQDQYAGAREINAQVREVRDRHRNELDTAESALGKAKKELKAAERKLLAIPR